MRQGAREAGTPAGWQARLPGLLAMVLASLLVAWPAPVTSSSAGPRALQVDILSGDTPAAEVLAGDRDGDFAPLPGGPAFELPATTSGHWLRLTALQPWRASSPPVLALRHRPGTALTLHLPPDYRPRHRSLFRPDPDSEFSTAHPGWLLPADMGPAQPLFLHVDNRGATRLVLELREDREHRRSDLGQAQYLSAIHVALLLMVLVVFCYWLILRERLYLHYIAYIGSMLMFSLLQSGQGYALPGIAHLAGWGLHGIWFFLALSVSFVCSFAQLFMNLPVHAPRLSPLISVARWLFLALALAVLLPWQTTQSWVRLIGNPALMITIPVLLVAALQALLQGNRYARFYLVGWLPVTILTFLFTVQASGWIHDDLYRILATWQAAAVFEAVVLSMGLAYRALTFRRERDTAQRMAEVDGLTGVLNRRALGARLQSAFADAASGVAPLSVIFLDLDHFKQINDRHGHVVGDECLRAVSAQIRQHLRQVDSVGRYGGEEFLAVLPGADGADAARIAQRIRRGLERHPPVVVEGFILTVSVGVASWRPDMRGPVDLIARADAAMYQAKRAGRNRVTLDTSAQATVPAEP